MTISEIAKREYPIDCAVGSEIGILSARRVSVLLSEKARAPRQNMRIIDLNRLRIDRKPMF